MRASRAPLHMACPSSARPADYEIEVAKAAADEGSVAHELTHREINNNHLTDEMELHYCAARGVDRDQVVNLVRRALRRFEALQTQDMALLKTEAPMAYGGLTGTPDVRWVKPGDPSVGDPLTAVIVDWKFGREQRDHYHQLAQYAWLYREELRESLRGHGLWEPGSLIEARIEYPRLGKSECYIFADADLDAWREQYDARLLDAGRLYNPGDHCGFCPHVHSCEPRLRFVRGASQALAVVGGGLTAPSVLGANFDTAKALRRALDNYDKALDMLLDAGERVPLPDGSYLRRGIQEQAELLPRAAWPVLTAAGFTAAEMAEVTSIGKGKVEAVVREKSKAAGEKRMGKARVDEMMEKLREAGAVETKYRKVKEVVKDGE